MTGLRSQLLDGSLEHAYCIQIAPQTALELVQYQHHLPALRTRWQQPCSMTALLAGCSYGQAPLGRVEGGRAGVVCRTSALSCMATACSKQAHHHTSRHYSTIWCTRSEPPTMQARRFASASTLADATRGQSAILPTGAGSQAVVESTPPRPGHALHHWPCDLQ